MAFIVGTVKFPIGDLEEEDDEELLELIGNEPVRYDSLFFHSTN